MRTLPPFIYKNFTLRPVSFLPQPRCKLLDVHEKMAPDSQTSSHHEEDQLEGEKASYYNSENVKVDVEHDFSSIDEKKLLRKLDWALVPWVCLAAL